MIECTVNRRLIGFGKLAEVDIDKLGRLGYQAEDISVFIGDIVLLAFNGDGRELPHSSITADIAQDTDGAALGVFEIDRLSVIYRGIGNGEGFGSVCDKTREARNGKEHYDSDCEALDSAYGKTEIAITFLTEENTEEQQGNRARDVREHGEDDEKYQEYYRRYDQSEGHRECISENSEIHSSERLYEIIGDRHIGSLCLELHYQIGNIDGLKLGDEGVGNIACDRVCEDSRKCHKCGVNQLALKTTTVTAI